MTSFKTKAALSVLAVALLATPALAQRQQRQTKAQDPYASAPVEHYPNGAPKTGSAAAQESGADFNLGY